VTHQEEEWSRRKGVGEGGNVGRGRRRREFECGRWEKGETGYPNQKPKVKTIEYGPIFYNFSREIFFENKNYIIAS